MNKLSPSLLSQIYLLLALLAVTILSPLPYSPLALVILLVMLFIMLRSIEPRLKVAIMMVVIFTLPLLLTPALNYLTYSGLLPLTALHLLVAAATLPSIYLLDQDLRQNAQKMAIIYRKGKQTTSILNTLSFSTLSILVVSLIINNRVLLFTSIILVLYLLATLIRILHIIPGSPLDIPGTWKRIVAGTTIDIPLQVISQVPIRIRCLISPVDSWVTVTPQKFTLNGAKTELNLSIVPPLAGLAHPQLQVSIIDARGFIQVNQLIEPVELQVIPRARYAEWLAMKYLEETGTGATATAVMPPKAVLAATRGGEYSESRIYQPGDSLRDIDRKHTMKLSQLIVKEYLDTGGQVAIIAVNLSVTDAEEADKLAFNLITTALTLAHEAIPTVLAIYNHQEVVLATTTMNPREALKRTLSLVKDIISVEFAHRFLQLPDIGKLRRNITQLKQVTSEPGQRLLGMLDFEYRAIEQIAKKHPATLALSQVTDHITPPAMILVVSQLNHDAEALLLISEKLSKRRFTILPIETADSNLRSTSS
ncbi:DUF58 domain-containing protein [Chloroflexota bacterium]